MFAKHIRLTIDQYWRRVQASRVMAEFPKVAAMLEAGELHLSHVAMLSPKLTRANEEVILPAIRNKSRREVRDVPGAAARGAARGVEEDRGTRRRVSLLGEADAHVDTFRRSHGASRVRLGPPD